MTKRAIAQTVSGKLNITQQEAKRVVQNVLDVIKETDELLPHTQYSHLFAAPAPVQIA